MRFLTEYKKVQGLGAGHSGTHHFIEQRMSAVALVILLPLFLIFVAPLIGEPIEVVREGLSSYWRAFIAGATAVFVGLHTMQGLQMAIEDYMQGFARVAMLAAMRIGIAILVLATLFALVTLVIS